MAKTHWLWPAYAELAQNHRMTADEAIEQLQALWPSLPVRAIIRAEGNVNATLADVMAADELAQQTQGSGNGQQPDGQQQSSGTQTQQTTQQQGSEDESQGDGVTFNDLIRARAGRGQQTTELSHAQIMAAGTGKPANEGISSEAMTPEPDFIRAAFDRRYGRG